MFRANCGSSLADVLRLFRSRDIVHMDFAPIQVQVLWLATSALLREVALNNLERKHLGASDVDGADDRADGTSTGCWARCRTVSHGVECRTGFFVWTLPSAAVMNSPRWSCCELGANLATHTVGTADPAASVPLS